VNQAKIKFAARFVEPMLCTPVKELPEGPVWEYELKLDGYRALGLKSGGRLPSVQMRLPSPAALRGRTGNLLAVPKRRGSAVAPTMAFA
jgi:hypothetical protein